MPYIIANTPLLLAISLMGLSACSQARVGGECVYEEARDVGVFVMDERHNLQVSFEKSEWKLTWGSNSLTQEEIEYFSTPREHRVQLKTLVKGSCKPVFFIILDQLPWNDETGSVS